MADTPTTPLFVFPRWANYLLPALVIMAVGGGLYSTVIVAFGFSPMTTAVGYEPVQPLPYSHALHAGQLGIDCRYCHNTVERAAFAAIPPTQTCMNCHTNIRRVDVNGNASENLQPIYDSWATGKPIDWVKVHDLPDYVYFNHSSHVTHGVGCATCHGRIDRMDVVHQVEPLSMSWCLDCHRAPEKYLRPKDQVTNMNYQLEPDAQLKLGQQLKAEYGIHDTMYMQSCSTCHR